ncbi:MAG TPA: ureidoglycolate lyase [Phycisphaerales bacterium]|nr:ureidoglycolate lyase [Phycisphaerales bacterium]HCD33132.1 ureidoglycolate lyase [Phycisphaerales bacterium]|tara:strand:+ start:4256 stop:5119 length:864 start_codon:yes stop_codon:yes gene_type:complete
MRLIRFGEKGSEKPGIMHEDQRLDCSDHFADWNHDFFANDGLQWLMAKDVSTFPAVPVNERWGSPIARPYKIICVGLNYADHAAESQSKVPSEPLLFTKYGNALNGPFDDVLIPRNLKAGAHSTQTDWEVELAIIIGKDGQYLESESQAAEHIAGYCTANDVSERDFQKNRCGQWFKGKSCDTFLPLGPELVTADEVDDPTNLNLELTVNGEVRQSSSTEHMIFKPHFLVQYISQFLTLEAGDIICTGTPPGVGMGMNPPQFLKDGDQVQVTVEGLGTQTQTFRNHP